MVAGSSSAWHTPFFQVFSKPDVHGLKSESVF